MILEKILPASILRKDGLQRVTLELQNETPAHVLLTVLSGTETVAADVPVAVPAGSPAVAVVWLPTPKETIQAVFVLSDLSGKELTRASVGWSKPRQWTFYVMVSSHTDIGLHNSQYHQRFHSSRFTDLAKSLCDKTEKEAPENQYRYVMEGTWFFHNYPADRTPEQAKDLIDNYIKKGKIGVCGGLAGNHTQNFGLEETCRAACYRRRLHEEYGIDTKTMTMIDNNGLSWAIVQPFADAGFENLIFAPNQWNPLPSTVWPCDRTVRDFTWNPDAGGGGARVDVRYDSQLPMLFYWMGADGKSKLLVWASTQYGKGGMRFGISPREPVDPILVEQRLGAELPKLEARYPYDLWMFENYDDDQEPSLQFVQGVKAWNETHLTPKFRLVGDPDEPFRLVRERFVDKIPTLRGDITGGWYQHPLAAAEYLTDKLNTDRALASAEKIAVAAAVHTDYTYPAERLERAWDALICHDEHSYGTSGYQGRRVYETWMQHRDWLDKAAATAKEETDAALAAIGAKIPGKAGRVLVFNPMGQSRCEKLEWNGKSTMTFLPPFGYTVLSPEVFRDSYTPGRDSETPPIVDNVYYTVTFAENGSIASIYDKALGRNLLTGNANEFLYTNDNHTTWFRPEKTVFTVADCPTDTRVAVTTREPVSGAAITQIYTMSKTEKVIWIENRLEHVRDLFNTNRYYRYGYFAFPFHVECPTRLCDLGGVEAEYGKDLTGHGTDVYMAAHEYACAENGKFGVGLIQLDSQLIEFDHIHPDKTDYGNPGSGSAMYSYLFNDWLQMQLPGGSHLSYRFRYGITSYTGSHKEAGLCRLAERAATPPLLRELPEVPEGTMAPSDSFGVTEARFVGLKRSEDGNGLIIRLLGDQPTMKTEFGALYPCTTDEHPADHTISGFATFRVGGNNICLKVRPEAEKPTLSIASRDTGLITEPRAVRGESRGMLYLLWGRCDDPELDHYALYRSTESGFVPDEKAKLCDVPPEEYVVGRYIDEGLSDHTTYYYRVCAVAKDGTAGAMSEEFSGITLEI